MGVAFIPEVLLAPPHKRQIIINTVKKGRDIGKCPILVLSQTHTIRMMLLLSDAMIVSGATRCYQLPS